MRPPGKAEAALDAFEAPLFEKQFVDAASEFLSELRRHRAESTGTPRSVKNTLILYDFEIADAQNALDELRPPRWAEPMVDRYVDAVLELRSVVGDAREPFLDSRMPPPDVTVELLPRVERAERRVLRAAQRLAGGVERGIKEPPPTEGTQTS